MKVSRRHFVKAVGVGAVATGAGSFGTRSPRAAAAVDGTCFNPDDATQKNTLFDALPTCCPREALADGEMRITFLGTSCIPRLTQQGVSVYVEVGPTDEKGKPLDYAMFDCGMGVLANYIAIGIPYRRMDKIFLGHLHADHMSELSAIYCFGEANDRKSPLYVWGPGPSGWPDPLTGQIYDDGTKGTLEHWREVLRWHTESFSFTSNSYAGYEPPTKESWGLPVDPIPVGPRYRLNPQGTPLGPNYADPLNDSYALVPIELDWRKSGQVPGDNVAYNNPTTGLKITHFPAIHCRRGSISYKLEWTPPGHSETLSMIYSSDTKPNHTMIQQASNGGLGIDVLAHEIVMPPDAWATHFMGISDPNQLPAWFRQYIADVQNSSHTTQAAFGYLLSQISPRPRLSVATHFQAQDDTIASARTSIAKHGIPDDAYTFAADFMVLNVIKGEPITPKRAVVSKFAFAAPQEVKLPSLSVPKYFKLDANGNPIGDPYVQIDTADGIAAGPSTYDPSGY